MSDWLLTVADVIQLHDDAIEQTGGSLGILSRHLLEAALARPVAGTAEAPLYPDVFSQIAAAADAIARWHPFVDGNKRAALLAASVMLQRCGLELCAAADEQVEMMCALAQGKLGVEDFARWLRERTCPESKRQ